MATERPSSIARKTDRAADAVWRQLTEGVTAPWLDEVRNLRTEEDGYEASLDIWSVALTAELHDPERRTTAAAVLARLRGLFEDLDAAE